MTRQEIYDAIIAECIAQQKPYSVHQGSLGTVITTNTNNNYKQITVNEQLEITFISRPVIRANAYSKQYSYTGTGLTFYLATDHSQVTDIPAIVSEL